MSPKENPPASLDRQLKAVLAEYNDCREEIKIRIQQRTRMTEFYIVGLAAIAGFAIQSRNYCIMVVAPAYAVFIYSMIIGTYFYTDSLGNYIREEIELKKIPYILGKLPQMVFVGEETSLEWKTGWLAWETNFFERLTKGRPPGRKKMLYVFSWGIILVSTISLIYGLIALEVHFVLVMFLALIMLFAYGFVVEWVRRQEYLGKRLK
jgi:hypothetical protein